MLKRFLFISILLVTVTECIGQPFNYLWAKNFGGRPNYNGKIKAAYSNTGYIYMTGDFKDTQSFGTTTLSMVGYTDSYITSYDTAGTFVFAKRIGAPFSSVYARSIAADNVGNMYVCGYYIYQVIIDGQTIQSVGLTDIFLAKMNSTGNLIWLVSAGGTSFDEPSAIYFHNNKIYMTGYFVGTSTFGTHSITATGSSDKDIFIASFDAGNGSCNWVVPAGGSGDDLGLDIKADYNGDLVVSGIFNLTATFGSNSVTSVKAGDAFLAKYTNSGTNLWVRSGGSRGNDFAEAVGFDQQNNYYITGSIGDTATFGNVTLPDNGYGNLFIVKYNSSGVFQWFKAGGSPFNDSALDIAVYPSGHSYVTGYIGGTSNFNGVNVVGSGGNDVLILHYNSSGGLIFGTAFGSIGNDRGKSILCNEGGGIVYIMGEFTGNMTLSGTTLTAPQFIWQQFLTKLSSGTLEVIEHSNALLNLHFNNSLNSLEITFPENIADNVTLKIIDMKGSTVSEQQVHPIAATLSVPVNIAEKGIYRAILYSGDKTYSASFMKY
ncbi:MAG: SBBP repeat-containing protein [Bacteroidia bacterium]|nr:SBBP repeat-containing protein [Bacteroidia bacterium]